MKSQPQGWPSYTVISAMDCMSDELQQELDRMETVSNGLTRLETEVWNEYQRALLLERSLEGWRALR